MATKRGEMADWLVTVIVAVIASIPGIYAIYRQRNKTDAEAVYVIGTAYRGLFDELEARIVALQRDIELIKAERTMRELELNNKITQLKEELEAERSTNKQLRLELDKAQRQITALQAEVRKLKKDTGELKNGS